MGDVYCWTGFGRTGQANQCALDAHWGTSECGGAAAACAHMAPIAGVDSVLCPCILSCLTFCLALPGLITFSRDDTFRHILC